MELTTISQVSKQLGISTRTLRYYEQVGLIAPAKKEDLAYRTYDRETIIRLRQIITLRKLRIPLKQIGEILLNGDAAVAIEAFEYNLSEIEDEIAALSIIRGVIKTFIERLNLNVTKFALLEDESLLEIVDSLTVSKSNFKEEKSMNDLNKASEKLMKIFDKDVRIISLPPSSVASVYCRGDAAEHNADVIMEQFVANTELLKINPGARFFGFNNPVFDGDKFVEHGYEVWATIPDDIAIYDPLTYKHFDGGLYAVFTSKPVSFEDWKPFYAWLNNSDDFEYDARPPFENESIKDATIMCSGWGRLEEHINSYNVYGLKNKKHILTHMDFLMPIKEREK